MNIAGIHQLIAHKRKTAEWNRAKAAAPQTCPRIAYDAEMDAKKLEEEATTLEGHAKSDWELIQNIEMLINYLVHSPYTSAHRTLALRSLEEASMRLRRELGDKTQD